MTERTVRRSRLVRWTSLAAMNLVVVGAVAIGGFLYGWARFAQALPELHGWYRQAPASEFRAADALAGYTFDDYLKQEEEVLSHHTVRPFPKS